MDNHSCMNIRRRNHFLLLRLLVYFSIYYDTDKETVHNFCLLVVCTWKCHRKYNNQNSFVYYISVKCTHMRIIYKKLCQNVRVSYREKFDQWRRTSFVFWEELALELVMHCVIPVKKNVDLVRAKFSFHLMFFGYTNSTTMENSELNRLNSRTTFMFSWVIIYVDSFFFFFFELFYTYY